MVSKALSLLLPPARLELEERHTECVVGQSSRGLNPTANAVCVMTLALGPV